MLKNFIAPLLICSSLSYAQELNTQEFQLLAKDINTKDNKIIANGDVVIFSNNYYLKAKKVIYDKKSETFELFDDVLILKDNNLQTQSNYALVNMKNDSFDQSPVFILEKNNNLWMNAKSSKKTSKDIKLSQTVFSSCDCIDPVWSVKVSEASIDTQNKWVHAYHPRLYIKDIPVFYSPYLAFPTDTTRRTGLLIPTIGYSNDDGFYYSQPIYFAPKANYDLEVIPQIRTNRGYGAYTYFRLADSKYSLLKLKTGFFEEKGKYKEKFNLKNKKHYGWNIDYERTKLFSKDNAQDGLYASINWLNDIEYKTVEDYDNSTSTEKKEETKINYFYNTPEYYGGLYARYYIDTELDSNDTTLQELPHLQFHSYNKEFWFNRLIYSLDSKFINYTRKEGINANIYEVALPINYTKYFFDDFLYLNIGNKSILSKYKYSNTDKNFQDGTLVQNETSIEVGTDLIKPFDKHLHTLNLNAKYSYPRNIKKDGDLYEITNNDKDLASFPIAQGSKNINLSLNQSLYKKDNLKQLINHKLSQSILYDDKDNAKFQDLENYFKIYHNFGSFSNNTIYNIQDKEVVESTFSSDFKYKDYSLDLGYYKSKNSTNSSRENLESYRIAGAYSFKNDYKLAYYENYNLLENIRNKQGIQLDINDRCWNLSLNLEKEIIPSNSNDNSNGLEQKVLYFNLQLKPIGGIKQKYKIDEGK